MTDSTPQEVPVENANLGEGETQTPGEESSSSSNTPFVVKRLVGQRDKLREKNSSLDDENNDLASEVARLTQENQRLQQAQQAPQTSLPPNIESFDNREDYRQAVAQYTAQVAQNAVKQAQETQLEDQRLNQFNVRVDEHYQQAQKMGKPDYEQAEINTINALGQGFVDGIVANSDNSAEILYMLGNSPQELANIQKLNQVNPVKATMEIGRLSAKAGSFNKNDIPAPETVLEGGKEPAVHHTNLQKKYDQELAKATQDGGDMSTLRQLRKQMREAGLL